MPSQNHHYYYTYHLAGNLTQRVVNGKAYCYTYNAQNKLKRILGAGFTNEFVYDSGNRRIALSNNTWRYFIHDGNIPIAEVDANTNVTRWFVRGVGIAAGTGDMIAEVVPTGTTETVHFYVSNHRGDTLMTLTDNGNVETTLRYDAFGKNYQKNGTFMPRYTFSTKEYLSDAILYLYAYRVYDPMAGRWTQRDPIDYQDSENLYQFCGNNPVNGVDLFGRDIYICNGGGIIPLHMYVIIDIRNEEGELIARERVEFVNAKYMMVLVGEIKMARKTPRDQGMVVITEIKKEAPLPKDAKKRETTPEHILSARSQEGRVIR